MKGVNAIIATILLLVIALVIIGMAFMMFQETAETSQESAEREVTESVQRLGGCMEIEGVFNNTVFLRNCGSAELRDFTVYIDGSPVTVLQQSTIESRKKGNITADILSVTLPKQENFMVSFVRGIGTLNQNTEHVSLRCGTETYYFPDNVTGPEGWYWTDEVSCNFTETNTFVLESYGTGSFSLHLDAFRLRSSSYDSGELCMETGRNPVTNLSTYVTKIEGDAEYFNNTMYGSNYCGNLGWYSIANVSAPAGKITVQVPSLPTQAAQYKIEVRSSAASDTRYFSVSEQPPTEPQTVYLWFEAEAGELTLPMQVYSDVAASNGSYIWVPNGAGFDGLAKYLGDLTTDDNYVMWGRVIAPTGVDDSFFVSVDSMSKTNDDIWDTRNESSCSAYFAQWSWDIVSSRGSGQTCIPEKNPRVFQNVNAGSHILYISQRDDGTKLDKILITNNLSYVPAGLGG